MQTHARIDQRVAGDASKTPPVTGMHTRNGADRPVSSFHQFLLDLFADVPAQYVVTFTVNMYVPQIRDAVSTADTTLSSTT